MTNERAVMNMYELIDTICEGDPRDYVIYVGSKAPYQLDGEWIPCDGRKLLTSEYKGLFEFMKTYHQIKPTMGFYQIGDDIEYREVFTLPNFSFLHGVGAWIKAK